MQLGAFSVSLSVKDLAASAAFYKTLGFEVFHDASAQNYMILKNKEATIGLFQGMFDGNILTFNPGWDANAQNIDPFEDVRSIEDQLQKAGLTLMATTDGSSEGPASVMLQDPDGNTILIDQHR